MNGATTPVKTIPLSAVVTALCTACLRGTRTEDGRPIGRFAAYSNYPAVNISCAQALRGHKPYRLTPSHVGPMYRGELGAVLERVRRRHGLAGVRKTWGAGMRALSAEFAEVVML